MFHGNNQQTAFRELITAASELEETLQQWGIREFSSVSSTSAKLTVFWRERGLGVSQRDKPTVTTWDMHEVHLSSHKHSFKSS